MHDMTIGKAARSAGVGVETIRFYERKGLIQQPRKPAESGFRIYPQETVARIRFIRQAQELGFSLREVRELLELRADPDTDAGAVQARATAKLDDVKAKIRQLQHIGEALERLIAACPGDGEVGCCTIIEALEGHRPAEGNAGPRNGRSNNGRQRP
jgi:MerR family mercuric resistance operon transcriptional regulator